MVGKKILIIEDDIDLREGLHFSFEWNEYLQNLDDKIEFYRQAINEQPEGND